MLPQTTLKSETRQPHEGGSSPPARLNCIAVDFTHFLPGAGNGGARFTVPGVVRHLSRILPDCDFVLFTTEKNHDELAILESSNVRRLCIPRWTRTSAPPSSRARPVGIRLEEKLAPILPPSVLSKLRSISQSLRRRHRPKGILKEIGADLLFCPFWSSFFYDPCVPMVCTVRDLNYLYNPQFYTAEGHSWGDRSFRAACRLADRLICISEFTRQTVLANSDLGPHQVIAIRHRLLERLHEQEAEKRSEVLNRLGLIKESFLLYPAVQFWPHKNHRMLFGAFGMYRARHPESDLRLVCTGAPDERMEGLQGDIDQMGLKGRIILPGYLLDEELAALFQSCRAVIFPSLFEGFGMPVLEGMAFGKPVLCSNVTSLPEVAGDGALYFDPRNPKEIARAIERITGEADLIAHLVHNGYQRLATLGGPDQMAQEYLQVFREAVTITRSFTESLQGVYRDGWTGDRVVVTYGAHSGPRHLEVLFHAPPGLPHERVAVTVLTNGQILPEAHVIRCGQSVTLRRTLPSESGFIECWIEPTFRPKAHGYNDDERALGCLCQACRIISSNSTLDLLENPV
jgi:glycosyltransferase involved in cell wall biosynthesis